MFYIIDLFFGLAERIRYWNSGTNALGFDSMAELLDFWFRHIGTGFDDLNVTGSDTRVWRTTIRLPCGTYSKTVTGLRRFRIMDGQGRSIDRN